MIDDENENDADTKQIDILKTFIYSSLLPTQII